ncbi:MAG: peptidoglycan recognition family protein [Cyanobacteria bacterium P01_E01_bin.6]
MTWLKLTRKALYLMKGGKYIDRVNLQPHSTPGETRLSVPLNWFRRDDAPNRMAIELSANEPEPKPCPIRPTSTWLKLTKKALYLMEGGRYLEKVDVQPHTTSGETRLTVPLQWFDGQRAPRRMAVELSDRQPEPSPAIRYPKTTWTLLTKSALYLMEGGDSFKYLDKVDLSVHNRAASEFRVTMPLEWFADGNAPRRMLIEPDECLPEPEPRATRILDVFNRVVATQEWRATVRGPFRQTSPRYIVIHHTADRNPPRDLSRRTFDGAKNLARRIQRSHMTSVSNGGLGFTDSGHNFLNTTGGVLLEGRHGTLNAILQGRCVRSAHAPSANDSPGIENEGCFGTGAGTGCPGEQNARTLQMSPEQWNSLVELCAGLCKACNIDPEFIRGHRDFFPTECPGQLLYNALGKLRADVRDRLVKGF